MDVVQKNPSQRLRPQIFRYASRVIHLQNGMLRLKSPADEGGESAAAVLLFTNALQMLDPVFNRLHMTEHHCGARSQSELVRDLHHFQPLIAVNFYRRNLLAHAINQHFTATTSN